MTLNIYNVVLSTHFLIIGVHTCFQVVSNARVGAANIGQNRAQIIKAFSAVLGLSLPKICGIDISKSEVASSCFLDHR